MQYDIFLSHSSADQEKIVTPFYEYLTKQGLKCFYSREDIYGGDDYAVAIVNVLKNTKVFFLIFTENSKQSIQVDREIHLAMQYERESGIRMYCFKDENTAYSSSIEYTMANIQYRLIPENPSGAFDSIYQDLLKIISDENTEYEDIDVDELKGMTLSELLKLEKETHSSSVQYAIGKVYFDEKNFSEAFNWFEKSAKQGDITAQCFLGFLYENGIGTIEDDSKAFQLYFKSANQGFSKAQYYLARCYENGRGCDKDDEKAFFWGMAAAEQDDEEGQFFIGNAYLNGVGCKSDSKKAFEWLSKSAEQDNFDAKCLLAICYSEGEGCEKDEKKAFNILYELAELNHSYAQYSLGAAYEDGIGCEKDEKEAFKWYLKAAENNAEDAYIHLARCYEFGIGCDKDEEKAFEWYEYGDSQNVVECTSDLGRCYLNGIGVNVNYEKAYFYNNKAAEQGSDDALIRLGYMFINEFVSSDEKTLEQLRKKAFELMKKAMLKGNLEAQYILALYYGNGSGCEKNEKKYFELILDAAEKGHPASCYEVACCYAKGKFGVTQDNHKYITWIKKGVELNNADCLSLLSLECFFGRFIQKDFELAFEYAKRSADMENHRGYSSLGVCYENGIGCKKDKQKAIYFYQKSIDTCPTELDDSLKSTKAALERLTRKKFLGIF